jgi:hypothetical protein
LFACVGLPLVFVLNLLYLNVPGAGAAARLADRKPKWDEAYRQPLDLVLCPTLHWGCRYLTVDHRTLVGKVWKQEAIADVRAGIDVKKALFAIEGAFLRERSLRFAKFDESRLYAADLIGSDLQGATFKEAQLQGAILAVANLSRADLSRADLSGADLSEANLHRAFLFRANLSRADLSEANLGDAYLSDADLSHADLSEAYLSGTDLNRADLSNADLSDADLSNVRNLEQQQLDKACGTDAKLPPGLTLKPCPPPDHK